MPKPTFDEIIRDVNKPLFPSRSTEYPESLPPMGPEEVFWHPAYEEAREKARKYIAREGPQFIGGELGELAGATAGTILLGPGAGTAIGAIGFSGLGGAIAKSLQQDYREYKGMSGPMTNIERLKMTGKAFTEEAVTTAIGRGLAKGFSWLAQPFKKKLIQGAPELADLAARYGTHLTPGQLTDAWTADTLETIAESSFFGGRRMKYHKLRGQPAAIGRYADDLARAFTEKTQKVLDPDTVGKLIDDVLSGNKKQFKGQAEALYRQLDKISEGVQVDISPLKEFASRNLEEAKQLAGIGATEAGDTLLQKVSKVGKTAEPKDVFDAIEAILGGGAKEGPPALDFKIARQLRTRLMREEDIGLAKHLTGLLDEQMERAAKETGGELYEGWRSINKFYKEGMEKYHNKLVEGLVKIVEGQGEPEKVVPYIFKYKGVSRLKAVKSAVGGMDTEAWRTLKAAYVENLLDARPGQLIGSNIPLEFHKMGEQALGEIFHPEELTALKRMGEWSTVVSGGTAKQLATGGSMVVQLVQGGAILSLISGKFGQIATPIFILPEVISQLATHRTTAEWLTQGFDMPVWLPEADSLGIRLAAAVRRVEKEQAKEKQQRKSLMFPLESKVFPPPEKPAFRSKYDIYGGLSK